MVKERNDSNGWVGTASSTSDRLPWPPPIRPSSRSVASACRTGVREAENSSQSSASEGSESPTLIAPVRIRRRNSAAMALCRDSFTGLTLQVGGSARIRAVDPAGPAHM